ncbi:MAG: Uncharacterized protein XD84_0398 [Desulfotomaculum sp. 46_80]|nr:MAG: Uncharacterized protein XD84_0398 [Desulfotomaculum sp. 46_80]
MSVRFQVLSSFSIDALKANKMRSFLTMLGIIIGVAAVILMMSIGQGAQQQVLSRINSLGSNLLTVMPGAAGQFVRSGNVNTLTLKDAQAIAKLTGVACVAPTVRGSALATCGNKTWTTSISGTTQEITDISSLEIEQGRFFSESDVNGISAVAVIGQTVYENLFDSGADPVGSEIRLSGVTFKVIGLLKTIGASSGGDDRDDTIYIPVTTAQIRLLGTTNQSVNQVQVQVQDINQISTVQDEIASLLRKRHRLSDQADDDFNIRDITQIQNTAQNVTGILTLFLAGVAMISLIVGGIGIMNIMLVSVTERTREIGLRMAIGATRQDILNQFLYEAILLSLTGSFFGIVFGVAGSKIFSYFAKWSTAISIQAVVLSVVFALIIGVFFGYYPARRASRLNPAEALSFE